MEYLHGIQNMQQSMIRKEKRFPKRMQKNRKISTQHKTIRIKKIRQKMRINKMIKKKRLTIAKT